MSAGAVVMLIIAILIVWGGLVAAILRLRGHPDPPDANGTGGAGGTSGAGGTGGTAGTPGTAGG